jgi:dTMP kinase
MADPLEKRLSGKFVVFDGPDGCGKTTQLTQLITRLEADAKTAASPLTVRRVREPGGTTIGEEVRKILLSPEHENMDVHCEMLLYMASRAQLVAQQIKPALAAGECVFADRFVSSTLAYQGGGGGLDLDQILAVAGAAVAASKQNAGVWPHLTLVFDLDVDVAMARLNPQASAGLFQDRIEQRAKDYFQRVRENYLWQAKTWPERYRIIDAGKSIPQVEKQVWKMLNDFFS